MAPSMGNQYETISVVVEPSRWEATRSGAAAAGTSPIAASVLKPVGCTMIVRSDRGAHDQAAEPEARVEVEAHAPSSEVRGNGTVEAVASVEGRREQRREVRDVRATVGRNGDCICTCPISPNGSGHRRRWPVVEHVSGEAQAVQEACRDAVIRIEDRRHVDRLVREKRVRHHRVGSVEHRQRHVGGTLSTSSPGTPGFGAPGKWLVNANTRDRPRSRSDDPSPSC